MRTLLDILWRENVHDTYDCFVLDQHADRGRGILKCHSTDAYFFFNSDPTGISLAAYCWVTIGEAENTEHMFLGFSRIGIEPTIYRTRSKLFNHYITDSIDSLVLLIIIQIYSSVRLLFQTLIIIIALLI